jgi:type II secretory pathway component GspD/PulD (secretin)
VGNPFSENDARDVVGTTNRTVLGSSVVLEPVEVGLCLKLLPTISEQTIQLKIDMNWSDYFGFDGNGQPKINTRAFATNFRLGVNDEVVFGGLKRQVLLKSTQKTPILGSLPIIGYFFGGETQQNQTNELVVALKPTAIMDYDIATDYKMADEDKTTIEQANDTVNPTLPATHFGFDQYLLDENRGETVPAIK